MPDLEQKVNTEISPGIKGNRLQSIVKNYLLDSTASVLFYTPIFAATEYYLSGMESEEVLKSRAMGVFWSFTLSRPYSLFRDWWADVCHADASSSNLRKLIVDTSAITLFQIPISTLTYCLADVSLEEAVVALPATLAVSAVSGRPYGWALDKWRKLWGAKTTLE